MMKYISALAIAAIACLSLFSPAEAATVSFSTTGSTNSAVLCVPSVPDNGPNNCNYSFSPSSGASGAFAGLVNEVGTVYKLFDILPNGNDSNTQPDSFSFTTAITLLVDSVSYSFSALATVINWNPSQSSATGLNGAAALIWSNVASSPNAPVTVSFLTSGPFDQPNSGLTARILISAVETSVVPLPAGVLLLGSALLGLFGLSRRRKLASA